jgi:hypothetical protein
VNSAKSGLSMEHVSYFSMRLTIHWLIRLTGFAIHLFVLGYLDFKSISSLREISFLSNSSKAFILRRSGSLVLNLTHPNESENE